MGISVSGSISGRRLELTDSHHSITPAMNGLTQFMWLFNVASRIRPVWLDLVTFRIFLADDPSEQQISQGVCEIHA
jgi:hypothetical protein